MASTRVPAQTIEIRSPRTAPDHASRTVARLTAPVFLGIAALLASAGAAFAQVVDQNLWVTNGAVHSIARSGGTIYIGGDFTQVGPATGDFVAFDATTGAAQTPFPMVNGHVMAVAPDGAGGWYIGGDFSAVRGQDRGGLAHIDADGELAAWNPNPGGAVRALAVSGGIIYVGGYFVQIGGQPRNSIAALDVATGVATPWNPNATHTGGIPNVEGLVVNGGTIYACATSRASGASRATP